MKRLHQIVILFVFITPLISACSYSYMDEGGVKHIIGFVKLTIDPSLNEDEVAGHQVSIQSIGMSYISSPLHSGFALGYSNESLIALKDNRLVIIEVDSNETDNPKSKSGERDEDSS